MNEDELLDLVDENDEVIGEVWRTQANNDPNLIHREVGIIIANSQNQLLLQQRVMTKKVGPGYWTLAAEGHILKNALPLEAAHQELQEELGFDTDLTFWEKELNDLNTERHFTYWFVGKYAGESIALQKSEVADTIWLSQTEFEAFIKTNPLGEYTKRRMRMFWVQYDK